MKLSESQKLTLIILAAIITRVFTLLTGKPDFVGWFNHSYYYFVEVRGLLTEGSLPYKDMPLLFYLYALVAKILSGFGMEVNTAIVAATRSIMCIIPSLIPIPIYILVKRINGQNSIQRRSYFFPLTRSG